MHFLLASLASSNTFMIYQKPEEEQWKGVLPQSICALCLPQVAAHQCIRLAHLNAPPALAERASPRR